MEESVELKNLLPQTKDPRTENQSALDTSSVQGTDSTPGFIGIFIYLNTPKKNPRNLGDSGALDCCEVFHPRAWLNRFVTSVQLMTFQNAVT